MEESNLFLRAALNYANKGWPVIPLLPNDKRPIGELVPHGLKDGSTNQDVIKKWWNDAPWANIGIVTGTVSGLVVVDIDRKGGKDGLQSLQARGIDIGDTLIVDTPSGGLHAYFKYYNKPIKCGTNIDGMEGVDIRGENGYVVAPPSAINGVQYRPANDTSEIAKLPKVFIDIDDKRNQPVIGNQEAIPLNDCDPVRLRRAENYVNKMDASISGQGGHNALMRCASALVIGFGLSNEDAIVLLRRFNERCVPPWTDMELSHKINDARKNPRKQVGYLLPRLARQDVTIIRNFTTEKDGRRTIDVPKKLNDIIAETYSNFGGFPRRLGTTLFDYDEGNNVLYSLTNKDALFAWMMSDANCLCDWKVKNGFVTKAEVFEGIYQKSKSYDAISDAPHYPSRDKVFYTYGNLPKADDDHKSFWRFLDFFNPATPADRTLMAAFFCAPMFYQRGYDRPMWIIDTVDSQGAGKSSVVEKCAEIYNETAMMADFGTLDKKESDFKKRLISEEGRKHRFVLFDNLTETIRSNVLAQFITAPVICERAAYGRGEESRPNDITFCATSNGGTCDSDMAVRSYIIKVKAVDNPDPKWKVDVSKYLNDNRAQIYADIIDMLAKAKDRKRMGSRFGGFDSVVLSAVCKTDQEFEDVSRLIAGVSSDANEDKELAEEFMGKLENSFKSVANYDPTKAVIIRRSDVDQLLGLYGGRLRRFKSKQIAQFVKQNLLPRFSKDFEMLTNKFYTFRQRSFLIMPTTVNIIWGNQPSTEFQFIGYENGILKVELTDVLPRKNS